MKKMTFPSPHDQKNMCLHLAVPQEAAFPILSGNSWALTVTYVLLSNDTKKKLTQLFALALEIAQNIFEVASIVPVKLL